MDEYDAAFDGDYPAPSRAPEWAEFKILLPCSAERNWSTFEFIHNKKRNRLGALKAADLVYVHYNLRVLDRGHEL